MARHSTKTRPKMYPSTPTVTAIAALLIFAALPCPAAGKVDYVLVDKSEQTLYLLSGERTVKAYHVVFGENPVGPKLRQGDKKTPEGTYILDYKKEDSAYHKAIRISYPNRQDLARARAAGVNPGGQIMIHGQKNGFEDLADIAQQINWTNGCIAVTNPEMDEIWQLVEEGTPIEILP